MVEAQIVEGDLLDQEADCIVNSWNTNIIPWWLLLPHGVSGAIKKRGGLKPFFEVGKCGFLSPGKAVKTSAGRLPYKFIIHAASINVLWVSTKESIVNSVINSMKIAQAEKVESIAFPLLGAGTGGYKEAEAERLMLDTLADIDSSIKVSIVRFKKR